MPHFHERTSLEGEGEGEEEEEEEEGGGEWKRGWTKGGRCPARTRRTRTLSFHSDRDRPRLHFRARGATPTGRFMVHVHT